MVRLTFVFSLLFLGVQVRLAAYAQKPNVVFILTDDQDKRLGSLDYLPRINEHLTNAGITFNHHYCTVSLCCPSRVSIWTGKHAHNHNVTDVVTPYGGYPKFISEGLNENWLPIWLKDAGYNSYYVGKLFNSHTIANYFLPFPNGFAGTEFILDPFQYQYRDPTFQRKWQLPKNYKGKYSTDLVAEKSLGFLEDAIAATKPFFLTIAPIAPHVEVNVTIDVLGLSYTLSNGPPVPAERHLGLFSNVQVPRTQNFNPDAPSGVSWIADLPKLNSTEVQRNDEFFRDRLRSLQSVDELVDEVITRLEEHGILNNTYIFFSSDNGYHVSQHRLQPGKKCGFEEDINVPLIVRGPGVPRGKTVEFATSHVDLAPTFLEILGIPMRDDFDGSPIPLTEGRIAALDAKEGVREHVQVEFWGKDNPNEWGGFESDSGFNNTYKSVRIISDTYDFYYSVWCTNEHELYDLTLNNLVARGAPTKKVGSVGVSTSILASRLDVLLFVLKGCKGEVCRNPWKFLLPAAGIPNLAEALEPKYDDFFNSVPGVSFSACVAGHVLAAEGPQWSGLSLKSAGTKSDGSDPDWAIMT
ncbi:hypothetical protein NM208_g1529 [Fusarium decemcellulare]|uniref:Uncharacterized protein n=1 Tax=Fusarium decemcellulare TaxID=57161 RepID=A0ACC1SWC7_9HYPO|nr:hypothetical protein NM208_g1529 [Fusarium decemcellulare]